MTVETARRATTDDVDALVGLAADAVAEQLEQRGGLVFFAREARPVPADESFLADLADHDRAVFVGELDDVALGYAAVGAEVLRDGSLHAVVTDLYVEPEARDVGLGELLMAEVVEWCRERGCAGVDAWALPGNRGTKNFFESFGLTARLIVVHRRLDE